MDPSLAPLPPQKKWGARRALVLILIIIGTIVGTVASLCGVAAFLLILFLSCGDSNSTQCQTRASLATLALFGVALVPLGIFWLVRRNQRKKRSQSTGQNLC